MTIGQKLAKQMIDDALAAVPWTSASDQIQAVYTLARLDGQRGVSMSIVPINLDAVADRLKQYQKEFNG